MILRRLATALKKQDWITISIEILIVVFGVFIGLQLGNWNSEQQERALYEQSFDRMIAELKDNVRQLEEIHQFLDEPIATVQRALEDLRTCQIGDDAQARVQEAFGPLGLTIRFSVNTTSIDQLIANEAFLRFQPSDLRTQLLDLSATLHSADAGARNVSSRAATQLILFNNTGKSSLTYAGPSEIIEALKKGETRTPELVRRTVLNAPLSQVCQDEALLNQFYTWEDNAYYQSVFSKLLADDLRGRLLDLGYPMDEGDDDTYTSD